MAKQSRKAVVLLSGGQDSTTALFWAVRKFDEVHALTIVYGQRHESEVAAARKVAKMAGVAAHEILKLPANTFKSRSPLVDLTRKVPEYKGLEGLSGVEPTFIPARNLFFLTLAANRAFALESRVIVIGVSQEDSGGYPDCRNIFIRSMADALSLGVLGEVGQFEIYTPLMFRSKCAAVILASQIPGCLEALAHTVTCYKGETPPCGKCHACLLRARGFEQAGIQDPLIPAARKAKRVRKGRKTLKDG